MIDDCGPETDGEVERVSEAPWTSWKSSGIAMGSCSVFLCFSDGFVSSRRIDVRTQTEKGGGNKQRRKNTSKGDVKGCTTSRFLSVSLFPHCTDQSLCAGGPVCGSSVI